MKKETRKLLIILLIYAILITVGIITKIIGYIILSLAIIDILFFIRLLISTVHLLISTQKNFKEFIEYEVHLELLKHDKYKSYFDYTIDNKDREVLLKQYDKCIEAYSDICNTYINLLCLTRSFLTTNQKNILDSKKEIRESSRE